MIGCIFTDMGGTGNSRSGSGLRKGLIRRFPQRRLLGLSEPACGAAHNFLISAKGGIGGLFGLRR